VYILPIVIWDNYFIKTDASAVSFHSYFDRKFLKTTIWNYTLKLTYKNHYSRLIFLHTLWLAIRSFLLFTVFFFYNWKSSTRHTITPYSRYRCSHLSLSPSLWCLLIPQKNHLCFLFRFILRLLWTPHADRSTECYADLNQTYIIVSWHSTYLIYLYSVIVTWLM